MLTIQPKLTNYPSNRLSFKGEYDYDDPERRQYEEKRSYYESQLNELNDMERQTSSGFGKKIIHGTKIAAEGILEGLSIAWAVTFCAKKFKAFKDGGIVKNLSDIVKPIKTGMSECGKTISAKMSKFAESDFVQKLDKSKVGHVIIQGFKYIGKGLKIIAGYIKKGFEYITKPLKKVTYEGATKATATTLGVGAGIGGAYTSAKKDAQAEKSEKAKEMNYNDCYGEED